MASRSTSPLSVVSGGPCSPCPPFKEKNEVVTQNKGHWPGPAADWSGEACQEPWDRQGDRVVSCSHPRRVAGRAEPGLVQAGRRLRGPGARPRRLGRGCKNPAWVVTMPGGPCARSWRGDSHGAAGHSGGRGGAQSQASPGLRWAWGPTLGCATLRVSCLRSPGSIRRQSTRYFWFPSGACGSQGPLLGTDDGPWQLGLQLQIKEDRPRSRWQGVSCGRAPAVPH